MEIKKVRNTQKRKKKIIRFLVPDGSVYFIKSTNPVKEAAVARKTVSRNLGIC